ncbi:pentapeptide repeat-containing protein [Nostoc sp. 'Peltigera membranacea cyanobiont' N6]|uniref:pentapeptide repeat-containing protein n=1 Tax=Nostoc sp. 'Peltigera membranacea cyanobiont' N6 TaxID=1261031 RepID=UPI000CF3268A|nr:pentapeptide repeat-containing protein [Nostoc sp. 'Peltigera membranacea cyanobiont' N6]AVH68537.1 pentapeptide repeat-containing protein [Nostoc sp. 'Peltigera membranacea cyanobiont' N6]
MVNEEHYARSTESVQGWNEWRLKNPEIIPDLSEADLSGANLSEADLSEAYLNGANLSMANLSNANLSEADLSETYLDGANLRDANLRDADLGEANLRDANLRDADLHRAYLYKAYLDGANLSGVNLSMANLSGVNLSGVNLIGFDLSEADLSEADLSGADLRDANLSGANLSGANLIGVDLSEANLSGAFLVNANLGNANLSRANLSAAFLNDVDISGANLNDIDIEEANKYGLEFSRINLSGANLSNVSLVNANIKHANLSGLNLSSADLTGADLSYSDLRGTNLNGADLIRIQALRTNFTAANFTGVCLEDWHINSATKLNDIDCQYVYLKSDKQERRPSSGEYAPGDFTKLFQKALETVDLIFADGIDWKAFLLSFQELQAEYGEENLSVQAIEKKSGGAFVIRLEVPPEANKADIERQARLLYEKELKLIEEKYRNQLQAREITLVRQHNADILNIIDKLANRPIQNTIIVTANAENNSMSESYQSKYDQRNSNNQFVDTAQTGSNPTFNQSNYAPEQRQNLAEAAAEIQQLLNQLAQSNSTTDAVTEAVHQKIKTDPTFKARLLAALKAGGLEALKAIFNHPAFSIPAETIKGFLEAE